MAVEAFKDLRKRIRLTLQDADGARFPDDELDSHINEGQLEYARRTRVLRARVPIFLKENEEVYTLPDDLEEVLRVEDKNGRNIILTSADTLEREFGDAWRTATGGSNPSHAYADLNGKRTISFFPRPKPSIEIAPTIFDIPRMQPINVNIPSTTLVAMDYDERNEEIIVLTTSFIEKYDREWNLIDRFAHSRFIFAKAMIRVLNVGPFSGEIFFTDGTSQKIYNIDRANVVTDFGTAADAGIIEFLLPIRRKEDPAFSPSTTINLFFFTTAGTGEMRSTEVGSFSESTHTTGITRPQQSAFANIQKDSVYIYYTTATSVRRIRQTSAIVDELVTGSGAWSGLATSGDDALYGTDTGVIKKIGDANNATVGSVTIAAVSGLTTLVAISGTDFPLFSDGNTVFSVEGTEALGVTEYEGDKEVDQYKAEVRFVPAPNFELAVAFDERLYWAANPASGPTNFDIWGNLSEEGGISSIDSISFTGEFGALTDFDDTDNPIYIEGEEGAITQIFDAGDEFSVWYMRQPKLDVVEITEELALVYYAVHKSYEKEVDEQHFRKSAYYFGLYDVIVRREMGSVQRGLINAKLSTRTYYF